MRRQSIFWIGLATVLLLVGFLGGRDRSGGPPLDPESTDPLGTRALTELVAEFGTGVRLGLPDDRSTTALVLADRLGSVERRQLTEWVESGGTLVVADPGSPLSPPLADLSGSEELAAGVCSIPGLEGLTLAGTNFGRYDTAGSTQSCFGQDGLAYAVGEDSGEGRIVALGGAVVFTNENLDELDNAVLVVELLAVEGGELAIVYEPGAVVGNRSLTDLIPTRVRWFGWQLLVAFAVYVLWRLRRFGRVVLEPQVVEMPGSLLVRASGELARRSASHAAAAGRLSSDLERRLRRQYRVPPDAGVDHLIDTVAARSEVDPEVVARALAPAQNLFDAADAQVDRDGLVALLADIDTVRAFCLADSTSSSTPESVSASVPEGAQHV